ncbi:hypothetical protein F5X68DRAFT_634 [Plectosphaerella plurivora]|uniref:Uncharacterized protein n=1 Tax=Plectosphaerella plurivora TaxID=936078 RepID=A0A9P9AI02_9PEZI|nr:hypothetical protein F5X68DRAFT_634 [Plectosphaerella plurivora]
MGIESRKAPPLPAPTEDSSITPTELTFDDQSRLADEASHYSLPDDGTPVTIRTRGHDPNRSQTSLLIEYFEGGKPGSTSGVDRKPSVRVRLTPSSRNKDHIQITETKGSSRKASLTRRIPLPASGRASSLPPSNTLEAEDADSIMSYASATEESNVSRNPIDIEIDPTRRRRRPASPLIPAADAQGSVYQPANMSEISAIPTDSFLDGSGPTNLTSRDLESKRSRSPSRGGQLAAGAAGLSAGAVLADKMRNSKPKERAVLPKSADKLKERERKPRTSKTRTSSTLSEKHVEGTRSPRRRSSRGHAESMLSGADSSVLSSSISPSHTSHRSLDQGSVRSGASKSSINNPKLLETVEDAIRRLILPELSALKREKSRRESRRSSFTSTATSVSRDDLSATERRRSSGRHRERRDREARHDYVHSPYGDDGLDSVDDLSFHENVEETPRNSHGGIKAAAAGAAAAGLAAAALNSKSPVSDDRKQRRRKRADGSVRSRSLGRERYDEVFEDEEEVPAPPMPLMASELNASELTRTSILSADTDRTQSTMDDRTPVHEVSRGNLASPSPAVAAVPATLQQSLGTRHANISHGDLRELRRERDSELSSDSRVESLNSQQQYQDDYDDDEYDSRRISERDDYETGDGVAPDYYNTQDVPPPLKYVPYQPERRGLSPIYSVSGYTEGGSEAAGPRDSRTINGSPSLDRLQGGRLTPGSAPSNIMSRGFDEQSFDGRSIRSSGQDYRTSGYIDGSDLERVDSEQAVHGIGASPRIVHVPTGVESNVASLVDGSMVDQSVLTGGGSALSGVSGTDYDVRDSTLSYDERPRNLHASGDVSPDKLSVRSQQDYMDERDGSRTPTSSRHSRSFAGEYDLDEYGRKVVPTRYRNSPSTSRHSPTASEKAIALGAVGAAAAALKAAKDRSQQPTVEEEVEEEELAQDFVPEGVSRNKSFKQRTMEGREPANTPAHSIDRFDLEDRPKMGVSAMPAWNDPMPEIGYVDSDLETNPSFARNDIHQEEIDREDMNRTPRGDENWTTTENVEDRSYPQQGDHSKGIAPGVALATAGAAAAATAAAMAHSRQPSHEPEDEWQRTSTDRKRDTLITNPYDGASPVANPELLGTRNIEPVNYGANYHTSSPAGQKNLDEGYISQGAQQSPNMQPKGSAIMPFTEAIEEDPFYVPKGHSRHLSGMSQGMGSPIYDAASGAGIDRIESKDIIALMQHLMVRDAQRSARDTEILVTLVRSAAEMRNSFEEMKQILANTEDVIIKEVQENTEDTVKNYIGGPRPYPGSASRSVKGLSAASQSQDGTEEKAKKNSLFKRALFKSFGAKDTNDLSRIEDMLNQLLTEVDVLKAQSSRPPLSRGHSATGQSFDNLQPEGQYEHDRGYEPEGHAGTSTASHASQSGQLSLPQSRGPSTKLGYEPNRISTVHEDNEEDYNMDDYPPQPGMLTPGTRDIHRGSSVPLDTPPQSAPAQNMSFSSENTPRTDKGKKHKSRGSSSWFPKISRWSESTATSVGKAFRGSGMSSKRGGPDDDFTQRPLSRSGSDLGRFEQQQQQQQQQYDNDVYGEDHLHTGFSQTNLAAPGRPVESGPPPPATYMTPEDPKYKAHRNSLNLQHPQPRPGQAEFFKVALESQAHEFDTPMSPKSADWAGSATSLQRFPAQSTNNRYSGGSAATGGDYWGSSPAAGPPRPPKEPIENEAGSPVRSNRVSKLQKNSPLPYQSVESGYATGPGTQAASNYTGSPKLENRNLSGALGVPVRRPSGPRAMTPRSAEEEAAREERRRKRDTFGTVASNETDTF